MRPGGLCPRVCLLFLTIPKISNLQRLVSPLCTTLTSGFRHRLYSSELAPLATKDCHTLSFAQDISLCLLTHPLANPDRPRTLGVCYPVTSHCLRNQVPTSKNKVNKQTYTRELKSFPASEPSPPNHSVSDLLSPACIRLWVLRVCRGHVLGNPHTPKSKTHRAGHGPFSSSEERPLLRGGPRSMLVSPCT